MGAFTKLFGGGKMPAPPPPVETTTPAAPSEGDPSTAQAVGDARRKARAIAALAQGRTSTILTGAQGLQGSGTGKKKVLLGE